ncbi:MAG TPA: hypothetical protein VMZ22_07185 [Acidimicrobiales bacterium]|nr:hypothetical protein [Acidimicrobiales bacterium]
MTIKPGQPWGQTAVMPDDAVAVRSDRGISRALEEARLSGTSSFPAFGLLGGDLCRTLGGTGRLDTVFPLDAGEVLVDGRHHYFAAHVVARRNGWRDFVVAMNAQWIGDWNLGPKAHPNDGIVDAYEGHLGLFEWRKVRARLPTGSHLPHPRISATRSKAVSFEFTSDYEVFIDGEAVARARHLAIRIEPDALRVFA